MIKIYRKTATVKAEQFDGSDETIKRYKLGFFKGMDTGTIYEYTILTTEGRMDLNIGDWIATGVNGEHWPIADDVFKKTYAELPVIPNYVAEYINTLKSKTDVIQAGIDSIEHSLGGVELSNWIEENGDTFASAWLDGFQTED